MAKDQLHTLAMKGEYVFPTFCVTSVAKHYYCTVAIQEGNVYANEDLEVKGVHLKSSSSPPSITKHAKNLMETILHTVESGQKISMIQTLTEVGNVERRIVDSLLKGELEFYRQSKIKEPEAYTKAQHESPYLHHLFWTEVFAPKYGALEAPPYGVVKIPTILESKTDIKNWLDGIKDLEFAERMRVWMTRNQKNAMPTFYIASNYLQSYGMIEELRPIIATKKIVLDLTNVYRLILESIGFFPKAGYTIVELGY